MSIDDATTSSASCSSQSFACHQIRSWKRQDTQSLIFDIWMRWCEILGYGKFNDRIQHDQIIRCRIRSPNRGATADETSSRHGAVTPQPQSSSSGAHDGTKPACNEFRNSCCPRKPQRIYCVTSERKSQVWGSTAMA